MTDEPVKFYKQHPLCYLSSYMHLLLFTHSISFNEGKFRKYFFKNFKKKTQFLDPMQGPIRQWLQFSVCSKPSPSS